MNGSNFNSDFLKETLNKEDPKFVIKNLGDLHEGLPSVYAEVIESSTRVFDSTKRLELVTKTNESFQEIIAGFNTKYGLDIQLNFASFADSLKLIVDPRNKKIVELYLSETFTRFRTIIYMKMMVSISILSEQVLDPEVLTSKEMSISDKFVIVEKLLQFMKTVEEIYSNIKINSSDLELSRINDVETNDDTTNPEVDLFLEGLRQSIITDGTSI